MTLIEFVDKHAEGLGMLSFFGIITVAVVAFFLTAAVLAYKRDKQR